MPISYNKHLQKSFKTCFWWAQSSFVVFGLLSAVAVFAYDPSVNTEVSSTVRPKELENVGVVEKLGDSIDLNLTFTNESGELVPLQTYFSSHKPVLLSIVYYNCPNLCNFQLNGLMDVAKEMKGRAGEDYEVVAVSMDPSETAELANKKKATYMKALNQPGADKGWHLLVGVEENIKKLADQVGFSYRWDEATKQYSHSAAMYVITPEGKISRYLHGIAYSAQTLRMSIVEASNGKIGSLIEQVAMYCFQFDPNKNKYTVAAFRVMQAGAALTVVFLAIFLIPVWRRERQRKAPRV